MKESEEWSDIQGYEGLYKVSNLGRVFSLISKKILKTNLTRNNYLLVALYKNKTQKKFSVHRLVAMAFLSRIEGMTQINHLDGCKANNAAKNLEWSNGFLNQQHAFATGLNHSPRAENSRSYKGEIIATCLRTGKKLSLKGSRQISDAGFYPGDVYKCLSGKIKTVKGFKFYRISAGG